MFHFPQHGEKNTPGGLFQPQVAHANSFVPGPAVINTHRRRILLESQYVKKWREGQKYFEIRHVRDVGRVGIGDILELEHLGLVQVTNIVWCVFRGWGRGGEEGRVNAYTVAGRSVASDIERQLGNLKIEDLVKQIALEQAKNKDLTRQLSSSDSDYGLSSGTKRRRGGTQGVH